MRIIKSYNEYTTPYRGKGYETTIYNRLEQKYGDIELRSFHIEDGHITFKFAIYEDVKTEEILKSISDVKVVIDDDKVLVLDKNTRVIKSNKYIILESNIYYPQIANITEFQQNSKLILNSSKFDFNMKLIGEHVEERRFEYVRYVDLTNTEIQKNKYYYCFSHSDNLKAKEILEIVNEYNKLDDKPERHVCDIEQISKDIQALTKTIVSLSGCDIKEDLLYTINEEIKK